MPRYLGELRLCDVGGCHFPWGTCGLHKPMSVTPDYFPTAELDKCGACGYQVCSCPRSSVGWHEYNGKYPEHFERGDGKFRVWGPYGQVYKAGRIQDDGSANSGDMQPWSPTKSFLSTDEAMMAVDKEFPCE